MTDDTRMRDLMAALRARKRLANGVVGLVRGALVSTTLAAFFALSFAIGGWPITAAVLSAIVIAGPVLGAPIGVALPVESLRVARMLDVAAGAQDRFASALQLTGAARANRAHLVTTDALSKVGGTTVARAIPFRVPREARLIPVPLIVLAATFFIAPAGEVHAEAPLPEVLAQQWADLSDSFRRDLELLDDEDEALIERLERLAELLESQPDKKMALAELAKLRADIERQRKPLQMGDASPREAARKMQRSKELSAAAKAMRDGDYAKTSEELEMLAKQLSQQAISMDAQAFEAAAADLAMLAEALEDIDALREALEQAADAANAMNREELAKALERLAQQLRKNSDKLSESERLARAREALDELKRRLGQSQNCAQCNGDGCSACQGGGQGFVQGQGAGKGGLKAGWGSAQVWDGGEMPQDAADTNPDLAHVQEGPGASDLLSIMSPEENAEAAQVLREHYADMVRQAEADLQLESAPLSYREYLRRYFVALGAELNEAADENAEDAGE